MKNKKQSNIILAAIADEFCPPVKIIDAVTEIISWDIVEPNIYWEDDLECIALEWECPVGYLTVNVYFDRMAMFQNLAGIRKNNFDVTMYEVYETCKEANNVFSKYDYAYLGDDDADNL